MMRAYIGGTFDLFHPGHVRLLKAAREKFGHVIVSLNTDEFTERFKRRPIMRLSQRLEVVAACRYVDEVTVNTGGEDSRPAILASEATHIVHGDDWTGESLMKQMGLTEAWLKEHNIEMVYLPYTKEVSTTKIIKSMV